MEFSNKNIQTHKRGKMHLLTLRGVNEEISRKVFCSSAMGWQRVEDLKGEPQKGSVFSHDLVVVQGVTKLFAIPLPTELIAQGAHAYKATRLCIENGFATEF